MRFIRYPRAPRRALAAFVTVMVAASTLIPILAANASAGTLSSVSQNVVTDGTTPFDSSSAAGFDTGASNGVIRTRDSFTLDWAYIVSSAGDVTFTETLTNARWDSSSAGACAQGASAISTDKKTITCTLSNLSVGSGSYRVRAIADGAAANGSTVSGTVSAGATQSNALALTVSATPMMNVGTMDLFVSVANGPGASSAVTGYNYDVPIAMWANVAGAFDGVSGLRGLESLASPITLSAVPSSAEALLVGCYAGAAGGTRPSYPEASGGNGTSVLNAVRNAGSWACTQPSAGATVAVTVTGADTSLNSYPTRSANNSAITSNRAYFADGYVRLWVPKTATTPNAVTTFSTKITNFDPGSASGASNYGTGYATNQPNPGSCVAGAYQNCSSVSVNRVPQAVRPDVRMEDSALGVLPGASVSWDGLGQVTPNSKFYASLLSSVPISNESMTDVTMCLKWDSTKSVIDTSKPVRFSASGLTATIEYGTNTYSSLSALQAANCGRANTGSNWFTSVVGAGGASTVTAVRITFNGILNTGASMSADVPLVTSAGLTPGEFLGFHGSLSSTETAELGSTYNPSTATGVSGSRVTYLEARTSVSVAWDAVTSTVPNTRQITLTPRLLSGETARNTRVTVTLPSPCFEYVLGSASVSPSSHTPAVVGADGAACTADDGVGETLEFAFGDISSTPPPIILRTNILPGIQVPSNQIVTAAIASPSDPATSSGHTANASLAVASVAGFSLSKTADTGRVTEGSAFNYSINWRNGSSTQSGGVKIVDVMPFAGDSRGSSGFSMLSVNSVTVGSGAVVEYSSLDAATALALADSHPDGENASFAWTSVKPPHVSAIRIVIANLAVSSAGSATVNVTATGVQAGGMLKNDLYGVASFASSPIKAGVPLEIQTLGTSSIAVTKTPNLSEVNGAGQVLRYTIRVSNTGQEALSSVVVTDHGFTGTGQAPIVSCPSMILASGSSMDCVTSNYSVAQSDIDTLTSISNQVTVVAVPPAGSHVAATASAEILVRANSGLTLTQIPSPNSLSQVGAIETYTFIATNSGTRTLNNLVVHTASFNGSNGPSAIVCGATTLAPNASVQCTATYSVTQTDLDIRSSLIHRATATSTDSAGSAISSNSTQTTVPLIQAPEITLSKSAAVASFNAAGASIPFVFTVTNTGNVTLTDISIDEGAFTGTGALGSITCASITLAPNEITTCTAAYTATQSDYNTGLVSNTAKARGKFGTHSVVSNDSTVTVNASGVSPGMTIAVTSNVDEVSHSGDSITYLVVVTNSGNVTLTNVVPTVANGAFSGTGALPTLSCPTSVLDPNASVTCTVSYSVNQLDIDTLNTIDLVAQSTATVGSTPISVTAPVVHVDVLASPHLDVAATASISSSTRAGDVVNFSLRLVNDGAFTLHNVAATVVAANFNGNGTLGAVQCPSGLSLSPGQVGVCTVSYTVTQQDIDELGALILTASARGDFGSGVYNTSMIRESNDTAQVLIEPRAELTLVKSSTTAAISAESQAIEYRFVVTNLGTRTLHNVSVDEVSFTGNGPLGSIVCPTTLQVMAPGDTATCSLRYTTVAADMSQRQILNTAGASATIAAANSTRTVLAANTSARIIVKSSSGLNEFGSDSLLTLTGATQVSQWVAGFLALFIGGVVLVTAQSRRRL